MRRSTPLRPRQEPPKETRSTSVWDPDGDASRGDSSEARTSQKRAAQPPSGSRLPDLHRLENSRVGADDVGAVDVRAEGDSKDALTSAVSDDVPGRAALQATPVLNDWADERVPPEYASVRSSRTKRSPWWRPPIPWTVYRYVFREIVRVFVLANLAVCLLYMTLVAYQAVRGGLQLGLVWPLIVKTFAYPLYYSIPISFLVATTLVIGRMVGDLEISALRTHGMSHTQIYAPVMVVGVVLAGLSFYMNGWVVPHVHYEKRNIHKYVMEQLQGLGSGVNRRVRLPNRGTLWIGAYQGTELQRVHIALDTNKQSSLAPVLREHLPEGLPKRINIFAREGSLELVSKNSTILLKLRGVDVLVPETVRSGKITNEKFHQRFAISDTVVIPLQFDHKRPSVKDRTNPELDSYIDEQYEASLRELARTPDGEEDLRGGDVSNGRKKSSRRGRKWGKATQRYYDARTDWHRRLAFTLSCLTFPLLGVSLALLLSGSSRLIPFFVGNLVVIALFYPLLMVAISLGEAGWFAPVCLALPNVVLLGLGIHLTTRVVKQ